MSGSMPVKGLVSALVIMTGALIISSFMSPKELRSPDFLGSYGIVGNVTAVLHGQAPDGVFAPALSCILRYLIMRNTKNQNAAHANGATGAAMAGVLSKASDWRRNEAVLLLTEILRENTGIKDEALKEGVYTELIDILKNELKSNDKLAGSAAAALAISTADNDSYRKKKIGAADGISALVNHLNSEGLTGSRPYINAAWALANLLSDSSPNQALLLEAGGPELLTRLLGNGPDQRITQPVLYAVANLAAKNGVAQDAIRSSGALEVLVKMIENGMANYKMKASEPFHTEVLEHVADLQRKDPNVRAALAEVGGLEELLGLIEAGSEIKSSGTPREKQLVPVQDYNDDNELHSLRQLVRDLQDEVDSEVGLLPDMKIPSLAKIPSTSRYLAKPTLKSRQNILSVAAWALSNAVADNLANQDFAREAGAVEALVKLLEGAEDAFVAKGALSAISSLAQGNPANKLAIRKANGVEGLVKLLASNPADKEVLQATAKALKQMTAERPALRMVQRSGSRWLRVMGRQVSAFVFERLGIQLPPAILSIIIGISCSILVLASLAYSAIRMIGRSGSHVNAKEFE